MKKKEKERNNWKNGAVVTTASSSADRERFIRECDARMCIRKRGGRVRCCLSI